jgi:hypothetical protein
MIVMSSLLLDCLEDMAQLAACFSFKDVTRIDLHGFLNDSATTVGHLC